jgi:CheY-like chemotaxis protein
MKNRVVIEPQPSHHLKVLVVEDDLCLQTVLMRLLQHIDPHLEVTWVTTADQAWAELRTKGRMNTKPYDIFFSDILTPGIRNGVDFWKTCKLRYPDIPFVLSSGMPLDNFLEMCGKQSPFPVFLHKPFSVGECESLIKGVIDRAHLNYR